MGRCRRGGQAIPRSGVITAILSVLGLFAGHRFGAMLGSKLDIAGGLIPIGLGVKIFIEHEFLGGG